jgi:hypothetical protein
VEGLLNEIERYDATEAKRVSAYVRTNNSLERAITIYETIYQELVDGNALPNPKVESRELSRLLSGWLPTLSGETRLTDPSDGEPADITNPVAFLVEQLRVITALLRDSEADRAARLEQIHFLTGRLAESEADRAARLQQIHTLTTLLKGSDRSARLDQIYTLAGMLAGKASARLIEMVGGSLTRAKRKIGAGFRWFAEGLFARKK